MPHLLTIGHGYVAQAVARALIAEREPEREPEWRITGTSRDAAGPRAGAGVEMLQWPGGDIDAALASATHILVSVPPEDGHDPALATLGHRLTRADPVWVGYLSTTGVYGDRQGGWVDEDTPPAPGGTRGTARVTAEAAWRATGLPVHIFRLAGIYGPGRNALDRVRSGTARQIDKPGQVFSRAHVDDIAAVVLASMARPAPGRIYNVADDAPGPPGEVLAHAARLLDLPPPPVVPFAEADLSPMARSFYAESKRVRNDRIKTELGVTLRHPDYRAGLAAILEAERAQAAMRRV